MGITQVVPGETLSPLSPLQRLDEALQFAKSCGRNQLCSLIAVVRRPDAALEI